MARPMEKLVLKLDQPDSIQTSELLPDMVIYNADVGKRVSKPRYYVFDKEHFAKALPEDNKTPTVVVEVHQVAHSLEQIKDKSAASPSTLTATYQKCTIARIL